MIIQRDWNFLTKFDDYIGDPIASVPVKIALVDAEWANNSIFSVMSTDNYEAGDIEALYRTKAEYQDMSTAPASHIAVNPPYGFNTMSDPHYPGSLISNRDSFIETVSPYIGLGRYYSEAIQSHIQPRMLTITVGVPEFKNIFGFYLNAVDSMKAIIAVSGRSPVLYDVARGAATVYVAGIAIAAYPLLSIAFIVANLAVTAILGKSDPSYYSLKPTMANYLTSCNLILNELAINRGILEVFNVDEGSTVEAQDRKLNSALKVHQSDIDAMHKIIPGIVDEHGWFNIFAIVGGYQQRRLKQLKFEAKYIDIAARLSMARYYDRNAELINDSSRDITDEQYGRSIIGMQHAQIDHLATVSNDIGTAWDKVAEAASDELDRMSEFYGVDIPDPVKKFFSLHLDPVHHDAQAGRQDYSKVIKAINKYKDKELQAARDGIPILDDPNSITPDVLKEQEEGFVTEAFDYFKAGVNDGIASVNFIVDYEGSTTDTFANSVKDIPISTMVNGVSTTMRDARFSASGGNILGSTVNTFVNMATDVASGILDGFTIGMSGLVRALTGSAHIVFPKMVNDSTANVGTHQFKIRLGGPYSNQLALLMDIDVVLSLILGIALPPQVGRAAKGSPFICSVFLPGQINMNKAVLSSLTVNRGVGATQYTNDGTPTDIEIRFSFIDLDPVVAAPIASTILSAFEMAMDDYTGIGRYLGGISGKNYTDSRHILRKAILRVNRLYGVYANYTNPISTGFRLSDTIGGRFMSAVLSDVSPLTSLNKN